MYCYSGSGWWCVVSVRGVVPLLAHSNYGGVLQSGLHACMPHPPRSPQVIAEMPVTVGATDARSMAAAAAAAAVVREAAASVISEHLEGESGKWAPARLGYRHQHSFCLQSRQYTALRCVDG